MAKPGVTQTLRADAALTTSYVASSAMSVGNDDNASLYLTYTNEGAGNSVEYIIEYSADGTNWYQQTHTEVDATAGTSISKILSGKFVAVAAVSSADAIKIPLKVPDNHFRVLVKETIAAGSAGSLEVKAVVNRNADEDLERNVI